MVPSSDEHSLGKAYTAPAVSLYYDRGRCRHYAECVHGLPQCSTGWKAASPSGPRRPTTVRRDPAGPLLLRGVNDHRPPGTRNEAQP